MWNADNRKEFETIIADLLESPDVQAMKDLPQHSKTCNCFEHSLYVAYLSFLTCRRLNLDYVSATLAALLHDFSLRNWDEDDTGVIRLLNHPCMALEIA